MDIHDVPYQARALLKPLLIQEDDNVLRLVYEEYAAKQAWRNEQAMMEEFNNDASVTVEQTV